MQDFSIAQLMVPLSEYATVSEGATLYDAVMALEKAQEKYIYIRLLPFLFVFIWLPVMFWEPMIVLLASLFGLASQARADELIACLGLSLLVWLVPYMDLRLPIWLAFLYPLTILSTEVVALQSLYHSLRGGLSWKGRSIPPPRWRWL